MIFFVPLPRYLITVQTNMKKIFSLAILMAAFLSVSAQNVQLHYDLGHSLYEELTNRQSVTTTVEMFKADKWGSTYFFTDLDYHGDGMMGAYWEISREFNISKNKRFAAHIEYNGGVTSGETEGWYNGNRFQHAVLVGPAYNWHSSDFSTTFSLQTMYKYYFKNAHANLDAFHGFQLTGVWSHTFANGFCTFSGFADLWRNPNVRGKLIFLSEPQFWFNLNTLKGMDGVNLSLGTEMELSNNFVYDEAGRNDKFYAIPTVAMKWSF